MRASLFRFASSYSFYKRGSNLPFAAKGRFDPLFPLFGDEARGKKITSPIAGSGD